jgi:archaellum component FlaC
MPSSLEFLEARVGQLEKQLDIIVTKLNGVVSEAAIQRLLALRQSEINEMKEEIDRLGQIITNMINNP